MYYSFVRDNLVAKYSIEVSRLLKDSATLGGRTDGRLFKENLANIEEDLFFSLVRVMARSAPSTLSS